MNNLKDGPGAPRKPLEEVLLVTNILQELVGSKPGSDVLEIAERILEFTKFQGRQKLSFADFESLLDDMTRISFNHGLSILGKVKEGKNPTEDLTQKVLGLAKMSDISLVGIAPGQGVDLGVFKYNAKMEIDLSLSQMKLGVPLLREINKLVKSLNIFNVPIDLLQNYLKAIKILSYKSKTLEKKVDLPGGGFKTVRQDIDLNNERDAVIEIILKML